MRSGFLTPSEDDDAPELYPEVPVPALTQSLEPGTETERDEDEDEHTSEGSIDNVLDVANEEEVEETPSDFDVGEPWTPAAELIVDIAHQPERLLNFLLAYDVQWEHPFEVFHPEFTFGRTDHPSFQQVPTGVIKIAMDCLIPDGVLPDVEGDSLVDLAEGDFPAQLGDVGEWMWEYLGISVWHSGDMTYFQFLRTARRIEEIVSEFLMWDEDSNGALVPVRFGPAPTLLGTRRYNFNQASEWDYDEAPYSEKDTYYNVPAVELHASAEEFHAHDQWIRWDVVFALLLANKNCWP